MTLTAFGIVKAIDSRCIDYRVTNQKEVRLTVSMAVYTSELIANLNTNQNKQEKYIKLNRSFMMILFTYILVGDYVMFCLPKWHQLCLKLNNKTFLSCYSAF